jgi:hypothetical protein
MRRPSPAVTIASVALFFSLAGTGLAASKYLITSTHQIKPNVLRALKGKQGPAGPAGVSGVAGAAGAAGAAGTSFTTANVTTVEGAQITLCTFGTGTCDLGTSTAVCPTGSVVLGGGWLGDIVDGTPATSEPLTNNQWTVTFTNESTVVGGYFTAVAQCGS